MLTSDDVDIATHIRVAFEARGGERLSKKRVDDSSLSHERRLRFTFAVIHRGSQLVTNGYIRSNPQHPPGTRMNGEHGRSNDSRLPTAVSIERRQKRVWHVIPIELLSLRERLTLRQEQIGRQQDLMREGSPSQSPLLDQQESDLVLQTNDLFLELIGLFLHQARNKCS